MNNLLKGLVIGVLIVGMGAVAYEIWRSAQSPEADKIDKSTQEIIKKRCEIKPDSPDCRNLK